MAGLDSDTGGTMKKTPSNPTQQEEKAMHLADRRTHDRTHHEPWPEAMRDEFRKVQFLDAVEVDEVHPEAWHDIFACFEGRHIRFI